jgi:ATP-dependent Lhr-like helicase
MADPLMAVLEGEGHVLRLRLDGRTAFCDRRLLARIHRYTVEQLRRQIEPVTTATYLRFLSCWQHQDPEYRVEGPAGVLAVVRRLAGFEMPAVAWERDVLAARVRDYRQSFLDQLTLSGEVVWGRLWGQGLSPARSTPVCLFPRSELAMHLALAGPVNGVALSGPAATILEQLQSRGATFPQELEQAVQLLPSYFEQGLCELIALGLIQCDSFAALRQFFRAASKRRTQVAAVGRWSRFRESDGEARVLGPEHIEFVARQLLQRYGIVVRRVLTREHHGIPWRDLLRAYRGMELRGEVRGGRFVKGCDGEHFGLDEAVALLRKIRKRDASQLRVAAADPLNLSGILTPDDRVASNTQTWVEVL